MKKTDKKVYSSWFFFLLSAVTLSYIVYSPGFDSTLQLDSYKIISSLESLYENSTDKMVPINKLQFADSYTRLIPLASLYINIIIDNGINTRSIKFTNYIIHLINGLLVLIFCMRLLKQSNYNNKTPILAAIIALAWLLSAINMSCVLYAIQRMNQLATLFSLLVLINYTYIRSETYYKLNKISIFYLVISTPLFFFLALASKENAFLIPFFICLVEIFFYQSKNTFFDWIKKNKRYYIFFPITLVTFIYCTYLIETRDLFDYSFREFTLWERVLTQSRILWIYLAELLLPRSISIGLYHDGFPISKSILTPITTLISIASFLVAFGVFFYYRNNTVAKPIIFGFCFFLVGHLLESTIFPLELYFEHRNYLPSVGFYFGVILSAEVLLKKFSKRIVTVLVIFYFSTVALVSYNKSITWSKDSFIYKEALQRSYSSPRITAILAHELTMNRQFDHAILLLNRITEENPGYAFRANLHKAFIACYSEKPLNSNFYIALEKVTTRELSEEISQALYNLHHQYTVAPCSTINLHVLVETLNKISDKFNESERDTWLIDFYIAQFMLIYDHDSAISFLEKKVSDGNDNAAFYLKYLREK